MSTERPILFSGDMVKAILAGRKTMTRRVIKPQPNKSITQCYHCPDGRFNWCFASGVGASDPWSCPYGVPGDRLWVRETWLPLDYPEGAIDPTKPRDWMSSGSQGHPQRNGYAYRASSTGAESERCRLELGYKWKPSIHMPRIASRINLEVTAIRVERVQEISEKDAIEEGVDAISMEDVPRQATWSRRQDFAQLWNSINAKRGFGWKTNCWVWVVEFRRLP